jgi:hypothetical protein
MTTPGRPQTGHATVVVRDGCMEVRLPVEMINELAAHDASDAALARRLPHFAPELAAGFAGQLADPPDAAPEPKRVRVIQIVLTRTTVIGTTAIELNEPIEVWT